jgi:hypothetical protein
MPTPWTLPWKEASGKDVLDDLLKEYKVFVVPTNAGWFASNAGSGAITQVPANMQVNTGTTASSRGMAYCWGRFLNSGNLSIDYADWTKRLELRAILWRQYSDSEAVARLQIKESNVEGALAQRGIGVEVQNYAMYGEGYGTARGTVSLTTLSDNRLIRLRIVKVGAELQFWVDEVLRGRLTGAYVPNVQGTAGTYLVVSIVNGPTGGVNAYLGVGDIKIIQSW